MVNVSISSQRILYGWTYIAPATILDDHVSPEQNESALSLRDEASCDDLCYVLVLRRLDTVFHCQIAAHPHFTSGHKVFTVLLTEEQIGSALPFDIRIESHRTADGKLDTERLLLMLHAHVATRRSVVQKAPKRQDTENTMSVEVTTKELQGYLTSAIGPAQGEDDMSTDSQRKSSHLQLAFLGIMAHALVKSFSQEVERTRALLLQTQWTIIVQLQRWHDQTHQHLDIRAVPSFSREHQQICWRLTMFLPKEFSLIA